MPLKQKILFLVCLFGISACSVTKHLPAGESLYSGATIKVVPKYAMSKTQVFLVKNELAAIVRPLPNNQIFGFPYKVWFYYLFGKPEKEKGLGSWFRKRFGEPPILASKRIVTTNSSLLENYLNNEGYFASTVTGKLQEKNHKATAIYTAYLKPRYTIDSVLFDQNDTSSFGKSFVTTQQKSLLKNKEFYSFQTIKAERERIYAELRKKGFYLFSPDFLQVLADTSLGNHRLKLKVEVKSATSQVAKKPYFIKNIYIYNNALPDSSKGDDKSSKNVHIINFGNTFRRKIFLDAIGFRSGALYSSDLQDISLSRLIYLNNFKFVKNRFDLLTRSDSALLNINYFLTPLKKKTIQASIGADSKSTGFLGTLFNLTWKNRNTFRGGEQLSLSANIAYDWQIGGGQISNQTNTYSWFLQESLTIPRFWLPFFKVNSMKSQALPKTIIDIRYQRKILKGLYDQTSISANLAYEWQPNIATKHTFSPIAITIITPKNVSPLFVDQIFRSNNPIELLKILDERLILGANYSYTYTPKQVGKNLFYFKSGVDIAGNLAGVFAKQAITEGDPRQIFGKTYEQYTRFDADFRYFHDINKSLRWANRAIIGLGIPYGNSQTLPDFKQFFIGGTNSIRAFQARTIGPGSYYPTDSSLAKSLYSAGVVGGDIKLEMNTELRAKFTQVIYGAAFIDAGNVWMYKNTSFYDSKDALFSKNFLKELAVGTGAGLRFDFTYLIFRLDVAFPLRKPWLPENERWVMKNIDFGDKTWRRDNLVVNIAVGYPF